MIKTLTMPPEYHSFERDDKVLFFDPQNFIWFVTNEVGKIIVDALATGKDVPGIAERVSATIGDAGQDQDLASFVANYLSQLNQIVPNF